LSPFQIALLTGLSELLSCLHAKTAGDFDHSKIVLSRGLKPPVENLWKFQIQPRAAAYEDLRESHRWKQGGRDRRM